MIVVGIDPGTATTGFGVVRYENGKLTPLECGVFLTQPTQAMPDRLVSIYDDMNTLLEKYNPDTVGTERLFFQTNVTNAITVGGSVGVILLAIAQRGIPWADYTPMQVKMAVSGYGGADKTQVQANVTRLLGLAEVPRPDDAADALAVAICHAHSFRLGALGMATRRGAGR